MRRLSLSTVLLCIIAAYMLAAVSLAEISETCGVDIEATWPVKTSKFFVATAIFLTVSELIPDSFHRKRTLNTRVLRKLRREARKVEFDLSDDNRCMRVCINGTYADSIRLPVNSQGGPLFTKYNRL